MDSRSLIAALYDLRAIGDLERRALLVARTAANHLPNDPAERQEVIGYVTAFVCKWIPDDRNAVRREALALISPSRMPMPSLVDYRSQADTLGAKRIVGATKLAGGHERVMAHPDESTTIEIDPELGRVSAALGLSLPLLAWAAARRADVVGSGIVNVQQIVSTLRSAGGKADAKTVRRWAVAGAGAFFHASGQNIRLASYARVVGHLTTLALAQGKRDLVSTNPPGTQFVRVPVATNKAAWNAHLYVAWFNSRADHTRQISRFTLSRLWGVTRAQLLKWEKLVGIKAMRSYALHTAEGSDIPEHAEPVLTRRGAVQWRTRHSNRYSVPSYRIKHHRKIVRCARRVARLLTESETTDLNPAGTCGLNTVYPSGTKGGALTVTGRLVFFDQDGAHQAAKRLQHHYRSTFDNGHRHYIELGRDRFGNVIVEQSNDGVQRCAVDDFAGRARADAFFAATGGRVAWRGYMRGAF